MSSLELPYEHFVLQAQYAQIASNLLDIPISRACLEFTQFWRRVGNTGWKFDQTPTWLDFETRITSGQDIASAAYELYTQNEPTDSDLGKRYFGCSRFDFHDTFTDIWDITHQNVIKVHFRNNDPVGIGPLSTERYPQRVADLKAMFELIKLEFFQAEQVHGGTWLYNREEYRRIYPPEFTTNMLVEQTPFPRTTGIWGQFLRSNKIVDVGMAEEFLENAKNAQSREELLQAFKYRILFARAPISVFYKYYESLVF